MRLSPKFSPKLRRTLLKPSTGVVRSLVELSPSANEEQFRSQMEPLGAEVRSWSQQGRVATVDIPGEHLSELGDLDEVVYVEAGETYRP